MFPASVLTTINAPHSVQLGASELARCLTNPAQAQAFAGHMSSFFGEVDPQLQRQFALCFHISEAELISAARIFAAYSGESYPLAA